MDCGRSYSAEADMTDSSWLKTKTEKTCSHCGQELVLIDPTDVLAARPIEVSLICPICGGESQALLTVEQLFRSIYPRLLPLNSDLEASNDNAFFANALVRTPSELPPPGGPLH